MAASITTRSYDIARTGANDAESVLSATAVRTRGIAERELGAEFVPAVMRPLFPRLSPCATSPRGGAPAPRAPIRSPRSARPNRWTRAASAAADSAPHHHAPTGE